MKIFTLINGLLLIFSLTACAEQTTPAQPATATQTETAAPEAMGGALSKAKQAPAERDADFMQDKADNALEERELKRQQGDDMERLD